MLNEDDSDPFEGLRVLPRDVQELRHHLSRINHALQMRHGVPTELAEFALQPERSAELQEWYKSHVQRVVTEINSNTRQHVEVEVDPQRWPGGMAVRVPRKRIARNESGDNHELALDSSSRTCTPARALDLSAGQGKAAHDEKKRRNVTADSTPSSSFAAAAPYTANAESAKHFLVSDTQTFAELCDYHSQDKHAPLDLLPISIRPSRIAASNTAGLPPSVPCPSDRSNNNNNDQAPTPAATITRTHAVAARTDASASISGDHTPSYQSAPHIQRHRSRAERSTANTPTQRHRPSPTMGQESSSSKSRSTRPGESRLMDRSHPTGSSTPTADTAVAAPGGAERCRSAHGCGSGESSRRGTASTVKYTSTQATLLPPASTTGSSQRTATHSTAAAASATAAIPVPATVARGAVPAGGFAAEAVSPKVDFQAIHMMDDSSARPRKESCMFITPPEFKGFNVAMSTPSDLDGGCSPLNY